MEAARETARDQLRSPYITLRVLPRLSHRISVLLVVDKFIIRHTPQQPISTWTTDFPLLAGPTIFLRAIIPHFPLERLSRV